LEPTSAYLRLAERLWQEPASAGAYNFGPHTHEAATVRDVITLARTAYGGGDIIWGDGNESPREAGWLCLEIAKARHRLAIQPRWSLLGAVERTLHWYRRQTQGEPARDLCEADIDAFETAA
jgi:CDP-glucose 4,6-dehydratase